MKRIFYIIAVILSIISAAAYSFCSEGREIHIVYTNDNNGEIEPCG